jgi:hypothetical protein
VLRFDVEVHNVKRKKMSKSLPTYLKYVIHLPPPNSPNKG